MLWEKRIYGYENAFEQYGLDLKLSHQIFELLKGFLSGIILVFSIHAVNAFLGCATFSWPCSLSSLDAVTCFKVSLISVPGLWLLSLSLSGARQENGGLSSLLSDPSAKTPEEALVYIFGEVRRTTPSILYLPQFDIWWETAHEQLRAILLTLLDKLPSNMAILLLGTSSVVLVEVEDVPHSIFSHRSAYL
ncbi:hypothetical protein S245_008089 [Arachis hypogaea]